MTLGRLFGALCATCCIAASIGQQLFNCPEENRNREFLTNGGGNAPANTFCCFPFRYRSVTYNDCTPINNKGQLWCGVESNYEPNKRWGNCRQVATPAPTTTTSTAANAGTAVTGNAGGSACYTDATANTNSLGGTSNSATTLDACKAACGADANCLGLDFDSNKNPNECFLHTNADRFSSKRTASGVNQYAKSPCSSTQSAVTPTTGSPGTPGQCTTTYKIDTDTNSFQGTFIPLPNDTPLECRAYCTAEPNCVGFDLDKNVNPNTCYWHTAESFVNRASKVASSQGIDQYTKEEVCDTTSTQSGVRTSVGCVDTFTKVENTNSPQGIILGTNVEATTCESLCNSFPYSFCQAFDYDRAMGSCYRHTESYLDRANPTSNGVDQYRRNNLCQASSTTSAGTGCRDTFVAYPDTFAYDGIQQALSVDTVPECEVACLGDTSCNAYDFNSANECYLHLNPNYLNGEDTGSGVIQYRRNRICGGCVDSFEKKDNTLSYGGQPILSADTVSKCRGACLSNASCDAFDFNNDNGCFLHGANYLSSQDSSITGVNQYTRVRNCSSSGAPDSTTTSTEATTTGTSIAPPCPIIYETTRDTLYYGGIEQTGISNTLGCRGRCTGSLACAAYDFDTVKGKCYLHTTATYIETNRKNDATGVFTYRKQPCDSPGLSTRDPSGCTDTFRQFPNTLAYDGQVQSGINNANQCQDACLRRPNCVGVSFDRNEKTNREFCFFHLMASQLSSRNTRADRVDLYVRVPCEGGDSTTGSPAGATTPCQDSYTLFENTQALSGKEATGASTVEACAAACNGNGSCLAYDFNSANMCYLHVGAASIRSENIRFNTDGVNHYRRNFTCSAGPTTPPQRPSGSPGSCVDTFTRETETFYYGGVLIDLRNFNDQSCRVACLENSTCLGIDADRTIGCFLHFDSANFRGASKGSSADITHYRRVSCDGPDSTSAAPKATTAADNNGCVITFDATANTLSYRGTDIPRATTVEACQASCKNNEDCVKFDFDSNSAANIRCFIHVQDLPTAPSMNVTQYKKRTQGCGTTPSSPVGTPEPSCTMSAFRNQRGSHGVQVNANSPGACSERCARDPGCVATTWNRNENRGQGACFRHAVVAGVQDNSNCCQRFVKVCRDCKDRYERREDMMISGGDQQDARINVPSMCADACGADSRCKSFDFDKITSRCYLFLTTVSDSQLRPSRGVDNYILRSCTDTPASTTPRATTRGTQVPATECQDTFVFTANQQVFGGDDQEGTMEVNACEDLCRRNRQCGGFDFNIGLQKCYLFNFQFTPQDFQPSRTVNNYRRQQCGGQATPPPTTEDCRADITFMVDSSGSIKENGNTMNYQVMKNFIKNVTRQLVVGDDKVHVALVLFSTRAFLEWDFRGKPNQRAIERGVDGLRFLGGETYTSRAFKVYLEDLSGSSGGNRPDIRDVIILITDGNTTIEDRDDNLGSVLRTVKQDPNLIIMGVGIGNIDAANIRTITTDMNFVQVDDFAMLEGALGRALEGTGCVPRNVPGPGPNPRPGFRGR